MAALYVCLACKSRKRACDKTLPSCAYCARKGIICLYPPSGAVEPSAQTPYDHHDPDALPGKQHAPSLTADIKSDLLLLQSMLDHASLIVRDWLPMDRPAARDHTFHKCVTRLIDDTGISIVEVHTRYLDGLHTGFPILIAQQLKDYREAVATSTPPTADVSVLMLVTTLLVMGARRKHLATELMEPTSLYLTLKVIYAKLQAAMSISLPMIQAGIMISIYELFSGRSEAALISIGTCNQMATLVVSDRDYALSGDSAFALTSFLEHIQWCIHICERVIACEFEFRGSGLSLPFTTDDMTVPYEPGSIQAGVDASDTDAALPLISDLSADVRGFARTAQAVWLLDRVLRYLQVPPTLATHDFTAAAIDRDLQAFIRETLVIDAMHGGCCNSMAFAVCAMFRLHNYIVRLSRHVPALAHWESTSLAALDVVAQIIVDVALSQAKGRILANLDTIPLAWKFNTRSALGFFRGQAARGMASPDVSTGWKIQAIEDLVSRVESRWHS